MKLEPGDAALAMRANDSQDLARRKLEMDALRKRFNGEKDQKAKLREACEGFESIFIQQMWDQMRKNVPKEGYLHSKDEHMYQGMYDQEFSRKMTSAGGIGLADMLYEQLAQRQGDSSRTVSPSVNPKLPIVPAGSSPSSARFNRDAQPLKPIKEEREGLPVNFRENKKHEIAGRDSLPPINSDPFGPPAPGTPAAASAVSAEDAGKAPVKPGAEAAAPYVDDDINFEHYSQAMLDAELEGREAAALPEQAAMQGMMTMTEEDAAILRAAIEEATLQAAVYPPAPPAAPSSAQAGIQAMTASADISLPTPPPAQAAAPASLLSSRVAAVPASGLAEPDESGRPVQPVQPVRPDRPELPDRVQTDQAGVNDGAVTSLTAPAFSPSRPDPALVEGLALQRRVSSPLVNSPSNSIPGARPGRPLSAPEHVRPVAGGIASPFGWEKGSERRVWHQGVEYEAAPGEAVKAAMAGRVAFAGKREGYGDLVIVEHEGGWRTFYGNAVLNGVREGDVVQAGTEFATVTARPENSSPGLHFEMRRGELAVNPEGSTVSLARKDK